MIKEVVDLNGEELQVGDVITFGDTTSTHNAVVCTGMIEEINPKDKHTEVVVAVMKNGGWNHYRSYKTFRYPRSYSNIVKIH